MVDSRPSEGRDVLEEVLEQRPEATRYLRRSFPVCSNLADSELEEIVPGWSLEVEAQVAVAISHLTDVESPAADLPE